MIAIHPIKGSFSDKWIEYCEKFSVPYKIVNCFDSDIIEQLKHCDGLMWHWNHWDARSQLFTRQLIYSLECIGIKVFPDAKTCWHFDDKVGQKYLLEAIDAPLVSTYVFYEKDKALNWAKKVAYPKIFKLRIGAGSLNVQLVKNQHHAVSLIKKAFGQGFSPINNMEKVKDRWKKLSFKNLSSYKALLRALVILMWPSLDPNYHMKSNEKGYIYFQDFIPDNKFDIRVIVIGDRAFAIKRINRSGNFKASGSGLIIHDKNHIPTECVKLAFQINRKLKSQCIAFDFLFDEEEIKLVEISYGFSQRGYLDCPGYWDEEMNWHKGKFTPEWFIIEDFLKQIESKS